MSDWEEISTENEWEGVPVPSTKKNLNLAETIEAVKANRPPTYNNPGFKNEDGSLKPWKDVKLGQSIYNEFNKPLDRSAKADMSNWLYTGAVPAKAAGAVATLGVRAGVKGIQRGVEFMKTPKGKELGLDLATWLTGNTLVGPGTGTLLALARRAMMKKFGGQ